MDAAKSSALPSALSTPPTSPTSSRTYRIPLTPQRRGTDIPHSPSTPHLALEPSAAEEQSTNGFTSVGKGLARSRTLPHRSIGIGRTSRAIPSLEGVTLEAMKLESLRKWILGLAIVTFDLELGPTLSCLFPQFPLYPFEAENIAFSAFPDSPQFREGSELHSFRIRGRPPPGNRRSTLVSDRPSLDDGFLYGYSYFSQTRDPSIKRGYAQWSIVILSQHPYAALFPAVLSKIGPLYRQHGEAILEVASHNMANWPPPSPGETLELGFLGSVIHAELPQNVDEQQLSNTAHLHSQTESDWHVLVCSPPLEPPPLLLFGAAYTHIWSIWECLVLCEPILIFGPSPAMTSQAVWWLRDLFRPIPWAGDFRPFFTIHDKDHNELVNDRAPKPGLLLGVTNPFFAKACSHWPNVLSLGRAGPKGPSSPILPAAGIPPGWTTKRHKRFISKDPHILQTVEDALGKRPETLQEASAVLRRHLSSRTAAMLVPLNRYLNSLIPPPTEAGTRLKPFNDAQFLASLKAHGSPLPFRSSSKQKQFYERWLRTPAFGLWLARQEEIVGNVLTSRASTSSLVT
ncbi:unnamed protein product [Peniophora sp. CBMAI 1063]|nr:unnamed protein product [Peniophora sp. CBMAI 1063]